MNTITMTVEQVRGVILASAKKDARYYLNGSLFDFEAGRVVSTDGHCLLAVNVDTNYNIMPDLAYASVIIPRDALEVMSKGGKVTDILTFTYSEDGLHIAREGGLSGEWEPINGTFPDYARVFPKENTGEAGQFDPDLLARISKALRLAIGVTKTKPITVGHNGTSSALVFVHGHSDRGIAVCMPMRAEGSATAEALDFWNRGIEAAA